MLPRPGFAGERLGGGVEIEARRHDLGAGPDHAAAHDRRQAPKDVAPVAVVVEDRVRRRQRAGPRVAAEQPARRQRVEGVVELGGLAVAHRRRLLLEEEPRAQRVALDLPDLADAETLRRLSDERAVREIELPDDEGGDLVAPIVEEAQRRERLGERLGGKAGEAHRLGGDARRREVTDDVADDRDGRALVDELEHARAADSTPSAQATAPPRRNVSARSAVRYLSGLRSVAQRSSRPASASAPASLTIVLGATESCDR